MKVQYAPEKNLNDKRCRIIKNKTIKNERNIMNPKSYPVDFQNMEEDQTIGATIYDFNDNDVLVADTVSRNDSKIECNKYN